MKKYLTFFIGALLLTCAATTVQAQPTGGGGPDPNGPAVPVPIDGGASLLLASGVAYGLRRLRARRQAARK